jgi:glycosyltransferase involved in cell wall biosynthesis
LKVDTRVTLQPGEPKVSVVILVRNGEATIKRAIDSALAQNYPRLEIVIQDGDSTDRTRDALDALGPAISVVSEADAGIHDRLWRALERASGDIITIGTADECLLPCAVQRGVSELLADSQAGAISGGFYADHDLDLSGNSDTDWQFDILAYLFGEQELHLSASFIRRKALEEAGLFESPWRRGRTQPLDLEIWCRLGCDHIIKRVPHFFAKSVAGTEESPERFQASGDEPARWREVLAAYLFAEGQLFAADPDLQDAILRRKYEIG